MPPHVSLTPGPWPAESGDEIILGLSPALWLRFHDGSYSDAGVTLCVADDPIYRVVDRSGNERHHDQATLGARPLWKTGIQNGKAVGRGDGVDDKMAGVSTNSAARTIFIVAKKNSAVSAANKTVFATGADNCQVLTHTTIGSGWGYFRNQALANVDLGGIPTSFTIIELSYTSAASVLPTISGVDGTAFDPNDGYTSTTTTALWSRVTGDANFGDYDIGEVIIFPVLLSPANRTVVRAILAAYYGLAI